MNIALQINSLRNIRLIKIYFRQDIQNLIECLSIANYMISLSNYFTQKPINQVIFTKSKKRIFKKLRQKNSLINIPHIDTRIKLLYFMGQQES